jgi:hypothetical protein
MNTFRMVTPSLGLPAQYARMLASSSRESVRPLCPRLRHCAYRGTRNLRGVLGLLGHESIAATERYCAVDDEASNVVIEAQHLGETASSRAELTEQFVVIRDQLVDLWQRAQATTVAGWWQADPAGDKDIR